MVVAHNTILQIPIAARSTPKLMSWTSSMILDPSKLKMRSTT